MIAKEAFKLLYPEKELKYNLHLKYSSKFKPYNANVKLKENTLEFNLSKKWKTISKEIQIGLIQELLTKILKDKKRTTNMELYNIFMKKIHIAIPKTRTDPILEESFDKINKNYFFGLIEKPNLTWHNSSSRLGSYEYGSDTISISKKLKNARAEILDYVMHHEILHKKHKFENKKERTYHHTAKFKRDEKKFKNQERIEKELKKLTRTRIFFKRFFIK